MNIEMFYVRSWQVDQVAELVRNRLVSSPDDKGMQPDWGLPSSYDQLLANTKRRIALSPVIDGWVAGIESKEVVDFALLHNISVTLKTDVLAVQVSDVAECSGYALSSNGVLMDHRFDEEDDGPMMTIRAVLKANGISHDLVMFREIPIRLKEGWRILM